MDRDIFMPCELNDATNAYLTVTAEIQFEQDWQNAISGDELVKRVHHHIDRLYADSKPDN